MKKLLLACSILAVICTTALPVSADTITDPFTGGIDGSIWTYWGTTLPPASVVGNNNRVEVTLGGLDPYAPFEPTTKAGLTFNPVITGNFIATVDFELLNWNPILPHGLRVGFEVGGIGDLLRIGDPISPWNGNSYVANFAGMGGDWAVTPALGSSYIGSLRFVRFADTISGYYMDETTNGDWVLISEQEKSYAGPTTISFGVWAHTDTASGRQVAFDTFTLTQHPVPEPSTMLLLGSGLAGLVGYGRRRMKK